QRVGLLAGGASGNPNVDAIAPFARGARAHRLPVDRLELVALAHEEGLLHRHLIDQSGQQHRPLARIDARGEKARGIESGLHAREGGLERGELLIPDGDAGRAAKQLCNVAEGCRHVETPFGASSRSAGAIWLSGSTALAPRSIAVFGIPKTIELSSSCAITHPPARAIAATPLPPSRPIPVRTTPIAPSPATAAMLSSSTSAEG